MSKNWNPAGNPRIGEVRVTVDQEVQSGRRDERVSIPLDPEVALRGLMQAGPHVEPSDD